jgi:hypothetical protein
MDTVLTMATVLSALAMVAGCSGSPPSSAPAPATSTTGAPTNATTGVPASSTDTPPPPNSGPVSTTPGSGGKGDGAGSSAHPSPGCAADGTGVPAGAASRPTIDVDGDGRPDTAWIQRNSDGTFLLGVTTASGATFGAPYSSASPIPPSMLVAPVDDRGTVAAIVSNDRGARLFVVRACSLLPVTNQQGGQYTFDLGVSGNGTGVGCSQVAGTTSRNLVGLKLNKDAAGTPVSVRRTVVRIDGTSAGNGPSDTVDVAADPRGSSATTATEISCGDLTLAANGVTAQ